MADENTPPPSRRRSSFAGQTFADLFGTGRSSTSRTSLDNSATNSPPNSGAPGPITTAAAQAQRRRLSLTTLGLSGGPNQTSPYNSFRARRDSISSANSGSIDESAIAEDDAPTQPAAGAPNTPATPFARRMSFGARALRDVRSSGSGGGGGNGPNGRAPPPAIAENAPTISSRDSKGRGLSSLHITPIPESEVLPLTHDVGTRVRRLTVGHSGTGEGFNWSDNLRTRAERTSIAGAGGAAPAMPSGASNHTRAKSVATMEPPVREMPKQPAAPDHFQERILKGDFYMD